MARSVSVFAPATVANVGCGFDILGLALDCPGDVVHAELSDESEITVRAVRGDGGLLPTDPDKNTASVAAREVLRAVGSPQGLIIELEKRMPIGSGLGSSAASAAAGAFAANYLLGTPLSPGDLLPAAMEAERIACGSAHADNIAPALLGGIVLIRSYSPLEVLKLPAPKKLFCTVVHPHVEIRTEDARRVLKQQLPLSAVVTQMGNVAGLVTALFVEGYELLGRCLEDVLIEPERRVLIPGYRQVKDTALGAGALGCSISGSGPSMFALSTGIETAQKVAHAMEAAFAAIDIASDVYVSPVNNHGPRVLHASS